jgi:hypothetical protein
MVVSVAIIGSWFVLGGCFFRIFKLTAVVSCSLQQTRSDEASASIAFPPAAPILEGLPTSRRHGILVWDRVYVALLLYCFAVFN